MPILITCTGALPKIATFQEINSLPRRTATTLKFRITSPPHHIRRKVARDIFNIEIQSQRQFRGYVQRLSRESVEVVLVTPQTTENILAPILAEFFLNWQVDTNSIGFEEINYSEVKFLKEDKFQIIQSNGEPEGYSNFFESPDDAFTIVSSIP